MKKSQTVLGAIAGAAMASAQTISVIPEPAKLVVKKGSFTLRSTTRIVAPRELRACATVLRNALEPATGFHLDLASRPSSKAITLKLDPSLQALGDEGYRLVSEPGGVTIVGFRPAGVFYGIQTLRQLLPTSIFRKARVSEIEWEVPAVEIEDRPRFGWRGGHLDVGRYFMPKESVLKHIDLLAMHKFNVLHLHLTEDQGWRIEIRKYPKLTEVGAFRTESMLVHTPAKYDGKPHGGFYTQDDIREIVAYAAERYVTVVPEIEMPGHAQAAIAAYPELGNTGAKLPVATTWGVIENVFNAEDSTIAFLQDVLTEVMQLFPSKFIHIGGDECPKTQWKASEKAQNKIKRLGLQDEHELQSWFIKQIDAFLDKNGRRSIGWDEILEGGLAPGATVMSWRGEQGGITAARAGHDVVMAPSQYTYFDYYQSSSKAGEPHAIGGYLPLQKVYAYEPIPKELNEKESERILGAQFQVWTEYMPTYKRVEYMAFPRACAFSEVVWAPKAGRDYQRFLTKLEKHLERLTHLDVGFRRPKAPEE